MVHAVHKTPKDEAGAIMKAARIWHKEVQDMVGGSLPEFPLLQAEDTAKDPMADPDKDEISDVLQHNVKEETLEEYGFKENEFVVAKESKGHNAVVWQIVTIDMDRQMVTMQQADSVVKMEKDFSLGTLVLGWKVTEAPSDKVMRSICVITADHCRPCKRSGIFRSRHMTYLLTTSPPAAYLSPPHRLPTWSDLINNLTTTPTPIYIQKIPAPHLPYCPHMHAFSYNCVCIFLSVYV